MPYTEWEDWQHGMYDPSSIAEDELIDRAVSLLSNPATFYQVCLEVIEHWPVATMVNLTNASTNRRAWLGQAACSYRHGVPEVFTRLAWSQLTMFQKVAANHEAERAIAKFEAAYRSIRRDVGEPMLF